MQNERLEKLLGMLGSDVEQERATAGRMIHHMAHLRGLTIVQLMQEDFGSVAGKRRVSLAKPAPAAPKRTVRTSTDEADGVEPSLRPLLDRLADLFENDRIDVRDQRFVENILAGFTHDAQLTPPIEARVKKIIRC